MVIVLLLLGLVLGGVFGFQVFKGVMIKKFMAQLANPVQTVSTITATTTPWQSVVSGVGSLRASQGADLSAEINGIVDEIRFESGQDVAAGTELLRLRPNDDNAKLAQLQAIADLDAITFARDQRQAQAQAVAQSTVDTDAGNLKSARAQVAQQQALMEEKHVRAPFAGRLGVRQVDLGQYLSAGTAIVTLQALDPLFADFYLPQQNLAEVTIGQPVTVTTDAFPSTKFPGTITAINARVDTASRTVQVRATLRNPERRLLPGMYASVDIDVGSPQDLITLPQSAITFNAYGSTVFVLEPHGQDAQGKAEFQATQTFVTTGATRGDQIAVLKGVTAGATIVTAGQLKLHSGSIVRVDNTVQPSNDAHPVVPDDR